MVRCWPTPWPGFSTAGGPSRVPQRSSPRSRIDANDNTLSRFYARQVAGKQALVVDDVRNTGQTQARCAELVRKAGGTVIATAEIYDRMEAMVDAGVPNVALAEYKAPDNYPADACPLCRAGTPVTAF